MIAIIEQIPIEQIPPAKTRCGMCRRRPPKTGRKTCQVCIDRAKKRRRRWTTEQKCVDCRGPNQGALRCEDCRDKHQAKAKARIIADRAARGVVRYQRVHPTTCTACDRVGHNRARCSLAA